MPAKEKRSSPEQASNDVASTPQSETAEMILTYDKNTGQVIRIENVDPLRSAQGTL